MKHENSKVIYLAGPYRGEVEKNIRMAEWAARQLWIEGHAVICPHLNTTWPRFGNPSELDGQDYIDGDLKMVERCEALVVLPGWEQSSGTKQEIAHAAEKGLPIFYWPNIPCARGGAEHEVLADTRPPEEEPTPPTITLNPGERIELLSSGASQSVVDERYDCLPELGVYRAATTAGYGAAKYGDDNWRKGIPLRSHVNHALRHLFEYLSGDRSEDHLGHAAWRALAAAHTDELEKRYPLRTLEAA